MAIKINASWYGKYLLPTLYRANSRGLNIRSKSDLLTLARRSENSSLEYWVCCSDLTDIEDTSTIVECMEDENEDVLKNLGVEDRDLDKIEKYIPLASFLKASKILRSRGKEDLADKVCSYVSTIASRKNEELTKMLWSHDFKIKPPETATNVDVKNLTKVALAYLTAKTKEPKEVLEEAVMHFINEVYLSDIEFKGDIRPRAVFADLYYKKQGDPLDNLDLNIDISESELQLVDRKHIPIS